MKLNFLCCLFLCFNTFDYTNSLGKKPNFTKYISNSHNDNNQKVELYYYNSLNSCYKNDYFSKESKYYYINQKCFIDEDVCRNNVVNSSEFRNTVHNIRLNISKCLNDYSKKGIYIYNKCLMCSYIYVIIDIECKSFACVYFFTVIVLILFFMILGILYLVCLSINRKKQKKYTLIRNN